MQLAWQEADRVNHPVIEPEHLLLAIVKWGKTEAAKYLQEHGIGIREIRMQLIEKSVKREECEPVIVIDTTKITGAFHVT